VTPGAEGRWSRSVRFAALTTPCEHAAQHRCGSLRSPHPTITGPSPFVNGFTLLELLVVLAIAVLLVSITPPLLTAAIPGVELKAAARQTAAGLRLAREEAIRSGRDAAFTLDLESHSFRVDGGFRTTHLPSGLRVKLVAAESEMQGEQTGSIRFFPDGSSTGGRVILSRGDSGYQVGVEWLTGRIRMAAWEAK
jgi:general secretion pathway protein H